jgi:hypothetical protein
LGVVYQPDYFLGLLATADVLPLPTAVPTAFGGGGGGHKSCLDHYYPLFSPSHSLAKPFAAHAP